MIGLGFLKSPFVEKMLVLFSIPLDCVSFPSSDTRAPIPFNIILSFGHKILVLKFKDPVLLMLLSGLTMNFMLYEKDHGLAIARLYCFSTFK